MEQDQHTQHDAKHQLAQIGGTLHGNSPGRGRGISPETAACTASAI
jgi:hypothetical protein